MYFMYFRRILVEGLFLHCPLSNGRLFTITAPEISFGVIFLIAKSQFFLFWQPDLLFVEVCGKSGGPYRFQFL